MDFIQLDPNDSRRGKLSSRDEVLASAVEAIIGAAYRDGGFNAANSAMTNMGIDVTAYQVPE